MLRLYLVRHGIAEDVPEGTRFADPTRPLTEKGRRRFRRIAHRLARLGDEIDSIYTSPALRAVQTAELLAAALHQDAVRVLDELRSDGAATALLERLQDLSGGGIALVGHKRQLCELAALLAHSTDEEAAQIKFRRGAIVRIDLIGRQGAAGKPRWWIRPANGSLCEGLPVDADLAG